MAQLGVIGIAIAPADGSSRWQAAARAAAGLCNLRADQPAPSLTPGSSWPSTQRSNTTAAGNVSTNQALVGTMGGLRGDAHAPMTWSSVKAKLAAVEAKELLGLVGDLYRLSKENQAFLDARFATLADPLQYYKKIISECLYPDAQKNKPIQVAKAKKAVSDYKKAAADPLGEVELMVYFVEQGNDCTLDYGDIDAPFYDALILMYGRAVDQLLSLPKTAREPFRRRLAAILNSAAHIGWGYPDELRDHYQRGFGDEDLDD